MTLNVSPDSLNFVLLIKLIIFLLDIGTNVLFSRYTCSSPFQEMSSPPMMKTAHCLPPGFPQQPYLFRPILEPAEESGGAVATTLPSAVRDVIARADGIGVGGAVGVVAHGRAAQAHAEAARVLEEQPGHGLEQPGQQALQQTGQFGIVKVNNMMGCCCYGGRMRPRIQHAGTEWR
jgi:hypothetical protein